MIPNFSLVDTDGSIVFNYAGNRIECNLEFKYNTHLNFSGGLAFDKKKVTRFLKKTFYC